MVAEEEPVISVASVPNAGTARISPRDALSLLSLFFFHLPFALTAHLLRRPFSTTPRNWRTDFKRLAIRTCVTHLPLSLMRQKANVSSILESKRYSSIKNGMFHPVVRPRVSGTWIYKNGVEVDKSVADSDIVVYFVHGGGYVGTDPLSYATFLMCIAETIISSGFTVSIFALDYSYAPEAVFPCQLSQAAAGYEYLIHEMNVPSTKVAFLGDSAGGSILLSLLAHIQLPLSSVPTLSKSVGKPGKGIFLVSPWVSLILETGYVDRKESDLLAADSLRTWATGLLYDSPCAEDAATYLEFAGPLPGERKYATMMPDFVWVSAGEDELFLDNIQEFVRQMRVEGMEIAFCLEKGQPHDWQYFQATENGKKFLTRDFGETKHSLSGAIQIGKAICGKGTARTDGCISQE